jgi:flagellar biosynthetic protein FlhB
MAEQNQNDQEKTEDPTPYRLEQARKKGEVAVSRELSLAIGFLGTVLLSWFFIDTVFYSNVVLLRTMLSDFLLISLSEEKFVELLKDLIFHGLKVIAPVALASAFFGVLTTLFQTRFLFSSEKLKPDIKKINPIQGIKKLFNLRSIVESLKFLAKFMIIGGVAYLVLDDVILRSAMLQDQSPWQIIRYMGEVLFQLSLMIALAFIALSAIDFGWQKYDFFRRMRMTKQEVKEEFKEREGDPLVKSRVKSIQVQMSRQRMLDDVSSADVVVTNPTHFSVALRYSREEDPAPRVVAKGADHIAFKIREIARENEIPLVENPPLARTLYKEVKVGGFIPENVYQAVAEVLAFVYRLKGVTKFAQTQQEGP